MSLCCNGSSSTEPQPNPPAEAGGREAVLCPHSTGESVLQWYLLSAGEVQSPSPAEAHDSERLATSDTLVPHVH